MTPTSLADARPDFSSENPLLQRPCVASDRVPPKREEASEFVERAANDGLTKRPGEIRRGLGHAIRADNHQRVNRVMRVERSARGVRITEPAVGARTGVKRK